MKRQGKRAAVLTAATGVAGAAAFIAYGWYWKIGAERAVVAAADKLVHGKSADAVRFDPIDPSRVADALRSGYRVAGFDNIGLGLRAYEVKLQVTNGDQYIFDAYHLDGVWRISFCGYHPRSESWPTARP